MADPHTETDDDKAARERMAGLRTTLERSGKRRVGGDERVRLRRELARLGRRHRRAAVALRHAGLAKEVRRLRRLCLEKSGPPAGDGADDRATRRLRALERRVPGLFSGLVEPADESDAGAAAARMAVLRKALRANADARKSGGPGAGAGLRAGWLRELLRRARGHPVASARLRLGELRNEIRRHRRLYHGEDRPEISDADYDRLYARLLAAERRYPELITKDSPSQTVGHAPSPSFAKVRHQEPMLSLDNALTAGEVRAFDARNRKELGAEAVRYCAELKLDGGAVNLLYVGGALECAATRGDGEHGEDITESVRTIGSVPARLAHAAVPDRLEVRGEVVMHTGDFMRLNGRQVRLGLRPFVNPRNAAVGNLRNQVVRLTASRRLHYYAYGVGSRDGDAAAEFSSQSRTLDWLERAGFAVSPERALTSDIDELLRFHARVEERRAEHPFGIDGVVYKVDDLGEQRRLGLVARAPRHAIAHKFDPEEAETNLQQIDVQIGRTGVLTPVARLSPVLVGGVVVSNATLHNETQIRAKGVLVPDRVRIRRAGDVIPEVVGNVPGKRPAGARPYGFPSKCPSCGSAVERVAEPEAPAIHRCPNPSCDAQVCARLLHFASRNALDIQGLGRKIVEALVARKIAATPADLFRLEKDRLKALPMLADESSENLLRAIESAKRPPLGALIHGLGIPTVGEAAAKRFAVFFRDLGSFRAAGPELLLMLDDVGAETVRQIRAWWSDPANGTLADDLVALGVKPSSVDLPPRAPVDLRRLFAALRKVRAPIADADIVRVDGKLPLEDVGDTALERVAEAFASPAELRAAPEGEIARRLGGSAKSAATAAARIAGLVRDPHYAGLIDRLQEMGALSAGAAHDADGLSGKTLVLTGRLEGLSRREATEALEMRGARVTGAVTSRTDFLVVGERPTQSKVEQARLLGVECWDEPALRERLGLTGAAAGAAQATGT